MTVSPCPVGSAAAPGSTILVEASGPEAEAVLDALAALVLDRFGEEA